MRFWDPSIKANLILCTSIINHIIFRTTYLPSVSVLFLNYTTMTITITPGLKDHCKVNGTSGHEEPSLNPLPISGATKLRRMLNETEDLIICPGVYDGLSARIAMDLGFNALYMVSLV